MAVEREAADPLSTRIDERRLSLSTDSSSGCCIFRVPNPLRQTNEKAYEPHIISIGPYHHGKDHLKGMEVHKMQYLNRLLQRIDETSVQRYVVALKGMEETIRNCYAEPLSRTSGEALVEMMLLDGCFIIELIRNQFPQENNDFQNYTVASVVRDLLLVENQLPFFVLSKLFHMTTLDQEKDFIQMALDFFSPWMPGRGIKRSLVIFDQNIKNLLALVHDSWFPSPEVANSYGKSSAFHGKWKFTRNATELKEAGIKFKKMGEEKSLFDIKFENGVLWIPTISMEDATESILRNLIAHEQCHNHYPRYVTDYVTFMDCLINTRKDVELLCRSRTIDNALGDDEVVATIFNGLCHSVGISDKNFYSEIHIKVRDHCDRKWNVWMANLRHNYFNTPWAWISFLGAVFLLILTAVQTIYSVLSYHHRH